MCSYSSGGSSPAGSTCTVNSGITRYDNPNSVAALPPVLANAPTHHSRADTLNFKGSKDITLSSDTLVEEDFDSDGATDVKLEISIVSTTASTSELMAIKNKQGKCSAKFINGKQRIPLSIKNIYTNSAAGGRGKAKVGGGGVPLGTCNVM